MSNTGQVKSLARRIAYAGVSYIQPERIMSPWKGTTSTYLCVRLYRNGTGKKFSIHRLVAEHFLPTWNERLEVNHIDGNRYNNAATNLEMCTHLENMRHAVLKGLKNDSGERNVQAKLTNTEAEEIRRKYRTGGITQVVLGHQYGVSRQTVSMIVRNKKYVR